MLPKRGSLHHGSLLRRGHAVALDEVLLMRSGCGGKVPHVAQRRVE